MMMRFHLLAAAFLLLARPASGSSDSTTASPPPLKPVRVYTTMRLTTDPPVVDGRLDDACWATGVWAGQYTQWIPNEGAAPSQPTQLKILYDDNSIYVAIRAFDSTAGVISVRGGRRDEFRGDVVGINFDSYHDHRTGFEFNLTSAGQKIDLLLSNPSNWDVHWNAVWFGKTGFEDSAWTAEYRIPLNQLRYSSDSVQVWGMHSWRWIDRLQEESDWEPQTSTGPGVLYQFGELRGIHGLPSPRRIEIMPYTLGRVRTFRRDPNNPFANTGREWFSGLGGDAKIGLASNFTADLTINPDFGQVESDPSVMNLTAFETFYEERRPFFLEGKNIFNIDYDDGSLFYSRRIGHMPSYAPPAGGKQYVDMPGSTTILSAAKISGKTAGGLSVGVLQSLTANEHATVDSSGARREVAVEPLTSYTFARMQQDFDNSATIIGGALTMVNRFIKDAPLEFLSRNAFAGGLDLLHQWNDKEYFVDAKFLASVVNGGRQAIEFLQRSSARYYQRPDADYLNFDTSRTSLAGHGGSVRIGKGSKGLWRYSAGLRWRSPGLELNDFGFMQQVDLITEENSISYFVNQPVGMFRTYSVRVNQTNIWDFGWEHLSSGASASLTLEFLNQWGLGLTGGHTSASLDTRILRGGPAMRIPSSWYGSVYFHTDQGERIVGEVAVSTSISPENGGGTWSVQPAVTVIPLQTVRVSLGVQVAGVVNDLQYVGMQIPGSRVDYILGRLDQRTLGATFRIDYSITPELTIQYYGSPFASVGRFSNFKVVSNPRADAYGERFVSVRPELSNGVYSVTAGGAFTDQFTFANPDFSFAQFRSNLVFRWEFRPGSNIYLVWSQDRTAFDMPGEAGAAATLRGLPKTPPQNVLLAKCSYWFSI